MQKTGQGIRPLHIILGNRNLEKFGEIINIPADSITYHPQFNAVDELSLMYIKKKMVRLKICGIKLLILKRYTLRNMMNGSRLQSEQTNQKKIQRNS